MPINCQILLEFIVVCFTFWERSNLSKANNYHKKLLYFNRIINQASFTFFHLNFSSFVQRSVDCKQLSIIRSNEQNKRKHPEFHGHKNR